MFFQFLAVNLPSDFCGIFSTMKSLDAKVALSELAKNGTEALVNGGMGAALQSVLGFA